MDVYAEAVVQGVPLIFVVLGLVEVSEKFGAEGRVKQAIALVIGLVFGVGFMFATQGVPAAFAGYFGYAVYGLGLGLVTSGVYDAGKAIAKIR